MLKDDWATTLMVTWVTRGAVPLIWVPPGANLPSSAAAPAGPGRGALAGDQVGRRAHVADQVAVVIDNRLRATADGGRGGAGLVADQRLGSSQGAVFIDVAAAAALPADEVSGVAAVGHVA